ncbi:hypothetical protein ES705_08783 [subsurface metagenome]
MQIIQINVDGLPLGAHNYTIVFEDYPGNKRASTIIVSVLLVIPEYIQVTVTSLILMIIGIISVSYVFKRKNKHKN